jgi:hypothetical protein
MSKEQIDAKIKQWFAPNGPGRLEVIARARHHELRKLVTERMSETAQSDAFANLQLELTKDANLPASTIETAQKLIIFKALLARQSLRINSVTQNHLQEQEMELFELPKSVWEPSTSLSELISSGKVSLDGIFQIELASRELPRRLPLHTVKVDLQRGLLVVTPKIIIENKGVISTIKSRFSKDAEPEVRTFPLRELNNLDQFAQKINTSVN